MAMLAFSHFEKTKISFNLYVILYMTRHKCIIAKKLFHQLVPPFSTIESGGNFGFYLLKKSHQ
jgi:hypothetical protein